MHPLWGKSFHQLQRIYSGQRTTKKTRRRRTTTNEKVKIAQPENDRGSKYEKLYQFVCETIKWLKYKIKL